MCVCVCDRSHCRCGQTLTNPHPPQHTQPCRTHAHMQTYLARFEVHAALLAVEAARVVEEDLRGFVRVGHLHAAPRDEQIALAATLGLCWMRQCDGWLLMTLHACMHSLSYLSRSEAMYARAHLGCGGTLDGRGGQLRGLVGASRHLDLCE